MEIQTLDFKKTFDEYLIFFLENYKKLSEKEILKKLSTLPPNILVTTLAVGFYNYCSKYQSLTSSRSLTLVFGNRTIRAFSFDQVLEFLVDNPKFILILCESTKDFISTNSNIIVPAWLENKVSFMKLKKINGVWDINLTSILNIYSHSPNINFDLFTQKWVLKIFELKINDLQKAFNIVDELYTYTCAYVKYEMEKGNKTCSFMYSVFQSCTSLEILQNENLFKDMIQPLLETYIIGHVDKGLTLSDLNNNSKEF